MNTVKSLGYSSEPVKYDSLSENEINPMALAHAELSFQQDWDLSDQEENDYWDSFA